MKSRLCFAVVMLALTGASCATTAKPGLPQPVPLADPPPAPVSAAPEWQPHQSYLNTLIARVQRMWEQILIENRTYPGSGKTVIVKFTLNARGEVAQILSVDGTAGLVAQRACVSAITAPAPFGAWTNDMVAALGQSQELTFTFNYQ